MVIRPKHLAVTEQNIQTSVALDGNPEHDLLNATAMYIFPVEDGHKTETCSGY
jgi:hypothetical protein